MNAKVANLPTLINMVLGKGTFAFKFYIPDPNNKVDMKKKVSTPREGDYDRIRGALGGNHN